MVIRNKHLLQVLAQLADVYNRVAHDLLRRGNPIQGLEALDEALADVLRIRPDLLPLVREESLDDLDAPLRARTGRLLALRAEILDTLGQPDWSRHSARLAAAALSPTLDETFDDGTSAAEALHHLLTRPFGPSAFTTDELVRLHLDLFEHHRAGQRFDRAEDALFLALDPGNGDDEILALGLAFYDELLAMTDAELVAGGLPRHEAEEAHKELQAMQNRD